MSRKKKHPEHVNHERWLVSYADFITLLFAFFVVLFASGQTDKRKQVQLAQAMQSAFTYTGVFDQHSKTPPISDEPATSSGATSPIALPIPAVPNLAAEAIVQSEKRILDVVKKEVAEQKIASGAVTVRMSREGLIVSLHEAGFFASGSSEIRPEAAVVLEQLTRTLPHQPMRIEGHTDNLAIHTAQFPTNWELSTARAASVTRLLLDQQIVRPEWISAAGYAEFHPLAANDTEIGRAQNRRVDIVILQAGLPIPGELNLTAPRQSAPGAKNRSAPGAIPDVP